MLHNIPFEYDAWDPQDIACWTFYDVTFTRDFGLIEAGQTFKFVEIDLSYCILKTFDEDGVKVLNTVALEIVAKLDQA